MNEEDGEKTGLVNETEVVNESETKNNLPSSFKITISSKENKKTLIIGIFFIVCLCVLAYVVTVAYQTDRKSINDANIRANREAPSSSDPSTWNLPNSDIRSENIDINSFLSSTTTYPLTYENVANGHIALTSLSSDDERYGYILFENGVSNTCVPESEYQNCDKFLKGLFTIIDVLAVPDSVKKDGITPSGFILVKRTLEEKSELFLVSIYQTRQYSISKNTNENIYYVYHTQKIELPTDTYYSLAYVDHASPFSNTDFTLFKILGGESNILYVHKSFPNRHGPLLSFNQIADGTTGEFPNIETSYTSSSQQGILDISYKLDDFWISPYYAQSNVFYQTGVEQNIKMYHKDACDLPYSFADTSLHINGLYTVSLVLKVSYKQDLDTFTLTTAKYGYVPEEWGTVVGSVNVAAYLNTIKQGIPFNGYPTEALTISNTPIRHTLPLHQPRPCDTQTFEQYQWVKDETLYTFEVSYTKDKTLTKDDQAFIHNTLETLIAGATYTSRDESLQ